MIFGVTKTDRDETETRPRPRAWFVDSFSRSVTGSPGRTVTEAFVRTACMNKVGSSVLGENKIIVR
jgi:hypothetical protein